MRKESTRNSVYSKRQKAEGRRQKGNIDGSRFQYLARVLIDLATAINIPVNDTTQPIDGGVVRYYDVAIAQAVAITYQSCKDRNEQGADLFLTAGNQGQINMGRFYISCNLAYDLGIAYGLNDSVSRPVRSWGGNYWKHMPSLNLNTDAKARQFVSFSSNFKPVEQ